MSTFRGVAPLAFRRIDRSGFGGLHRLDLSHAGRFLEPLEVILELVRRGPAHRLMGIECGGALAGFYVVHPDRRDASCWWLGWLALDRARQGSGIGRAAVAAALDGLRRLAGCRRVRLFVAGENAGALHLYRGAGFRIVGTWPATGELIMECGEPESTHNDAVVVPALTLVLAMLMRLWRRGVPPCARMSGEFHGPP